jgi:predicted metal-binding membrane protein
MLRSALTRDRAILVAGIVLLSGLAWLDLWRRAAAMGATARAGTAMRDSTMMGTMAMGAPWNPEELVAAGLMWSVMMVAMMLPSTAPLLLLFAGAQRTLRAQGGAAVPAGLLVAGYLVTWFGWSWLAASLQWTLQSLSLLPGDLAARGALGGGFLVLAGLYQFTSLKHACLSRCQSPLGFLMTQWREGVWGGVWMGIRYGTYCVGCCWTLMGLLFVAGIMNLVWIAALATLVLVEKAGRGLWPSRGIGLVLTVWGVLVLGAGLVRR